MRDYWQKIDTRPGSINGVPGQVCLSIDLRHPSEADLDAMQGSFLDGINRIAAAHPELEYKASCNWHSPVVRFDAEMVRAERDTASHRNYRSMDIVSGAGHDAFNLARVVAMTIIFVPCKDGISNNEQQYTAPEHAAAGANVLLDVVLHFANAHEGRLQLQE